MMIGAIICGSCCTGTNATDALVVVLLMGAGRQEWKVILMNGLWVVGARLRLVEGCGRGVGVGGGPAVGMHVCLPRL